MAEFRWFVDVARKRNAAFMPFLLDGAAPKLNQPDGIHPTAEGYRVVVDHLWPYVSPLLER
jgi:acyl-CoA thioesterase-1